MRFSILIISHSTINNKIDLFGYFGYFTVMSRHTIYGLIDSLILFAYIRNAYARDVISANFIYYEKNT